MKQQGRFLAQLELKHSSFVRLGESDRMAH
jgi:hypothetical protein